jgi:hypothetical protein
MAMFTFLLVNGVSDDMITWAILVCQRAYNFEFTAKVLPVLSNKPH